MLTEGKVRAIAAQVAAAIAGKVKPNVSDAQIESAVEVVIQRMQENGELVPGDGISDEKIAEAVELYFEENPLDAYPTTTAMQAAISKALADCAKANHNHDDAYAPKSHNHDGTYAKASDIPTVPTALPNPHPITINGTRYDGSEPVDIIIEGGASGGGGGEGSDIEVVTSKDEMTDTSKTYAYNGTLWIYKETPASEYVNLIDKGIKVDGNTGVLSGQTMRYAVGRFSGNSVKVGTNSTSWVTGVFSLAKGQTIRLYNVTITAESETYGHRFAYVTSALGYVSGNHQNNIYSYATITDDCIEITCANDNAAYIWFEVAANGITDASIITVNQEVTEASAEWVDTGELYDASSSSSSGSTAVLLGMIQKNTAATEKVATDLDMHKAEERGDAAVPSWWTDAVESAIAKVKAAQDECGVKGVNFAYFSDLHRSPNGEAHTNYLGAICAAVMDECHIPIALNAGDTMDRATLYSTDEVAASFQSAFDVLAPIGATRLLTVPGNHDGVWGKYTPASGSAVSYVNKISPAKLWNHLQRDGAQDLRRVYSESGSYYYVDNIPQKTRFICLDSHFYDGPEITGGTVAHTTFGFGAEQIAWFSDVACKVDSGWSVVIMCHYPPTDTPIGSANHMTDSIYDDVDSFRNAVVAAKAAGVDVVGIFVGHVHRDAIVEDSKMGCKVVTVTCGTWGSGTGPKDSSEATRVVGSANETAVDFVTVNRAARTVTITRLGVGSDRMFDY